MKTKLAKEVLSELDLFEKQRKKMENNSFEPKVILPHCFYNQAFEHFRGNKTPGLIEVAEAMRGALSLVAVANWSVKQHQKTRDKYRELQADCSLLEEKLEVVSWSRDICRGHLKDYKKMQIVIKSKMSRSEQDKMEKN